jgi:signal transduction histidine kinase
VAVGALVIGGIVALQRLGTQQAIRDARGLTQIVGQGIIEPVLDPGLLAGRRSAFDAIDRVVLERVLSDRLVRVKIWTPDGRIVYSDEPRLVGSRYVLGADEQRSLRTGAVEAEVGDLSKPENRFERDAGKLLEVYLPLRMPDGRQVLFETYQRFDVIAAGGRRAWLTFLPVVAGALGLLWLIQLPLAWRIARRLRRGQRDREALLARAVESSDAERRRIAADLHDGPVQDLAGLAYALEAATARADGADPALASTLRDAAGRARTGMRSLRTLLVEIHPPNLRAVGLEAALGDLLSPLAARGLRTELEASEPPELEPRHEALLFRIAQEALRNVAAHAAAEGVRVTLDSRDGNGRLLVEDDGRGFSEEERARRAEEGHVGLALLEELALQEGGSLTVSSAPGSGTRVEAVVPCR